MTWGCALSSLLRICPQILQRKLALGALVHFLRICQGLALPGPAKGVAYAAVKRTAGTPPRRCFLSPPAPDPWPPLCRTSLLYLFCCPVSVRQAAERTPGGPWPPLSSCWSPPSLESLHRLAGLSPFSLALFTGLIWTQTPAGRAHLRPEGSGRLPFLAELCSPNPPPSNLCLFGVCSWDVALPTCLLFSAWNVLCVGSCAASAFVRGKTFSLRSCLFFVHVLR